MSVSEENAYSTPDKKLDILTKFTGKKGLTQNVLLRAKMSFFNSKNVKNINLPFQVYKKSEKKELTFLKF